MKLMAQMEIPPRWGRLCFSGGHNQQADVPAANIVALFDSAYEVGRYPLAEVKENELKD